MHRFLLLIVLLSKLNSYGQIDQKKLDSLEQSIEVSTKAQKNWQDSFAKAQDSIYRTSINPVDSTKLLAAIKTKAKKRQAVILRIVIIAALFLTGVFLGLRKRKKQI